MSKYGFGWRQQAWLVPGNWLLMKGQDMSGTPATIAVSGGPDTHVVRTILSPSSRTRSGKTRLILTVGGEGISVVLERVQVSAHDQVPVALCTHWTITGRVITADTRLAEVGLPQGAPLVAVYDSETMTGKAW